MFPNGDSNDMGGTNNVRLNGNGRGARRNQSNMSAGGTREAHQMRIHMEVPGGRLTTQDGSCSINAPRVSIESIGFKNYLRNFLKVKSNTIKSEILREVVDQYNTKCGGDRATNRRRYNRRLLRPADPIDYTEEIEYEKMFAEQMDECNEDKCKPKLEDSIGFKNYFKMFRCRFPDLDKCKAMKKAKCIYENLSERTKKKYRDLGCDFKCCARRKAQPAAKSCKPKCNAGKKRPPNPCCLGSSSTISITESESEDESSSSCDLKAQKRSPKSKQNPCCPSTKRSPPKKPFCP